MAIAAFCEPPLVYYLCIFAAIPILLFAAAALVFIFTDPDRLHTEEHLERRQAMEIVEAKGQGVLMNPVDLVDMINPYPTDNPYPTELPKKVDGKE